LDGGEEDEDVSKLVQYPDNLTYRDLLYFLCAPVVGLKQKKLNSGNQTKNQTNFYAKKPVNAKKLNRDSF